MAAVDPHLLPIKSDLAKQLRTHVEFLASSDLKGRKPGTPGQRAAAEYITAQFKAAGLAPLPSLHGYGQAISEELGDNVIGIRPAAHADTQPTTWILIGAHYDHLGESALGKIYAGADDNASAVAIIIELARALPALLDHPILFVAFNTEEAPFIRTRQMGSQVFMDHLPREIGSPEHFHAAIIMDLMGGVHWEPLREVIFTVGAEQSPALYRHVRNLKEFTPDEGTSGLAVVPMGMHLLEELPVVGHHFFSDYDAFRNASVPYLFLSAGRTPRYHQPTDLPDTLHYERMAATVEWLATLMRRMDQDTVPYGFERGRVELADEIDSLRPLAAQASRWKTRIPGTSPLSLWRLKQDDTWLNRLDPDAAMDQDEYKKVMKRLERLSIRMQCLLTNFYGCSLM